MVQKLAMGWMVRGSKPGGARFSAPVQAGTGAQPASYKMGTGSFPGAKPPGCDVNRQPNLPPRLQKKNYTFTSPLYLHDRLQCEIYLFTIITGITRCIDRNSQRLFFDCIYLYSPQDLLLQTSRLQGERTYNCVSNHGRGKNNFLFSKSSRATLTASQPTVKRAARTLYTGMELQGRETEHKLPLSPWLTF